MYNLITAIRGGVSNAVKRYSHANMPHLPGWNPAEPRRQIFYFDAVNLYGSAMCEPLPSGNIQSVPEEELQTFNSQRIQNIPDESEVGYAFKVDLG